MLSTHSHESKCSTCQWPRNEHPVFWLPPPQDLLNEGEPVPQYPMLPAAKHKLAVHHFLNKGGLKWPWDSWGQLSRPHFILQDVKTAGKFFEEDPWHQKNFHSKYCSACLRLVWPHEGISDQKSQSLSLLNVQWLLCQGFKPTLCSCTIHLHLEVRTSLHTIYSEEHCISSHRVWGEKVTIWTYWVSIAKYRNTNYSIHKEIPDGVICGFIQSVSILTC